MAKAAREERDAQSAHERNQEVLSVLRKQMAALEEQKEAARRLKEEEAQLLVSISKIRWETYKFSKNTSKIIFFILLLYCHETRKCRCLGVIGKKLKLREFFTYMCS